MLPNPSYYGNPEDWSIASTKPYASDEAANKVTQYGSIQAGINAGYLELEATLDKSICYAAIADDSELAQVACIFPDGLAPFTYNDTIDFYWGFVDTGNQLTTNRQINVNDLSDQNEMNKFFLTPMSSDQYPYNNIHRSFQPYVSIVPYNFVLLVYVSVLDSNYNMIRTTLSDYEDINTYPNYVTHPTISQIEVTPYGSSTLSPTRTPFAINNNGGVALAYDVHIDMSSVSQQNNIVDYWLNSGNDKQSVLIWGKKQQYAYSNYFEYVKGKGGTIENHNSVCYYTRLYDREWIRRAVASLGLFFTGNATIAESGALDATGMYCGTISDSGLCHGDYTQGLDNRKQPQYIWTSTNESDYDPKGDPNEYSHDTNLPVISDYIPPYRTYIDFTSPMAYDSYLLNSIIDEVANLGTIAWEQFFIGQEPLSNIIAARRVFLSPPATTPNFSPIKMGSYVFEHVTSKMLVGEWGREYLKSIPIWRRYNNFLDYEPYTTISLYIPYCGSIKLPCQIFMGHSCNITINRNNRTGFIEAIVMVDNIEFATLNGYASMDMAVSGLAMAEFISKEKEITERKAELFAQAMSSTMGYIAGATISAAMENPAGVVAQGGMALFSYMQSTMQQMYYDYQLNHIAPDPILIQKAGSSVAPLNVLTPFIFIERPVYEDGFDENAQGKYSKTVGHACYRVGNLKDFHGLTVCNSAVLDGLSCTVTEMSKILTLLKGGVILD